MDKNFRELLKKEYVVFDGAMGTMLQAAGMKMGETPEVLSITQPQLLVGIHEKYLRAGADVIYANTFGANRYKLEECGKSVDEIVKASIKNAKQACENVNPQALVALDVGPIGQLLEPTGTLSFEEAYDMYREIVEAGSAAGADLVVFETMTDLLECKAAVLAAKEHSDLPVAVTMTFEINQRTFTGCCIESMALTLSGLGVDALGVNCSLGPAELEPVVAKLSEWTNLPIIVKPNAGLPDPVTNEYNVSPEEFAQMMKNLRKYGIKVFGGCCGTTPDHIHAMVELTKDIPVQMPEKKHRTVISSYSQAVVFDKKTIIIGERINPTGKSKFKQALRDHNLEYILREGVTQQDNGADVLDVNVGLPEIDEPSMIADVVKELQAVIDLPLQLDTSSAEAMERGLRVYNGKPLINSVNGKKEVMEQIFPLVAKYGGVVVGLCLDEDGIPETAEGRIAVGKKIIDTAAAYGIGPEDIILDGLCMTVSSDSQGAIVTLETLRKIRDELGGKSVLGVSNISFGLPQREIINGAFFTMAMESGLSAAIINPNSEAMMRAYYSFNALMNLDPQCSEYISIYSGQTAGLGQTIGKGGNGAGGSGAAGNGGAGSAGSLGNAIERGLKEVAVESVTALLKEKEALDVINEEIIPALDHVGKGFEKGTVFLPQLLMSAEAAKAAFEVIKNAMAGSGETQEKKGTIILATVKGDIHDIGKNIVKVLLENYSYDVIDLGKDVPPETVVEEAVSRHVPLVGLSALMTTTVPSMEETIKQLRESAPWVKVMVGGAVLTQEYADTIGADAYCKDAMASVHYAETVI